MPKSPGCENTRLLVSYALHDDPRGIKRSPEHFSMVKFSSFCQGSPALCYFHQLFSLCPIKSSRISVTMRAPASSASIAVLAFQRRRILADCDSAVPVHRFNLRCHIHCCRIVCLHFPLSPHGLPRCRSSEAMAFQIYIYIYIYMRECFTELPNCLCWLRHASFPTGMHRLLCSSDSVSPSRSTQ